MGTHKRAPQPRASSAATVSGSFASAPTALHFGLTSFRSGRELSECQRFHPLSFPANRANCTHRTEGHDGALECPTHESIHERNPVRPARAIALLVREAMTPRVAPTTLARCEWCHHTASNACRGNTLCPAMAGYMQAQTHERLAYLCQAMSGGRGPLETYVVLAEAAREARIFRAQRSHTAAATTIEPAATT